MTPGQFDQPRLPVPFGAQSTADEVLRGVDLRGRTALVTGGYSGLGLETTRALSRAGATVIVPARDERRAHRVLERLPQTRVIQLDLSSLADVARCGQELLASCAAIDMVITSAAVMACPETRVGPGWEAQFATNHLGHFALINHIRPLLRSGSRVICVSSAGHSRSPMRWGDVMFDHGYDKWAAYGQSKTANALFAVHLDRLGRDRGVRSFSLHPGVVHTGLARHLSAAELEASGVTSAGVRQRIAGEKTPEQGAATQVWAATSKSLDDLGGLYLEDCNVAGPWTDEPRGGVSTWAVDPGEAARLWTLSAELTGVDGFGDSP
ncbi:oxidoreductase [Aeromicrobium sp. Leaf350]|uniref:oxidoreductase n=1 Tax=Aeromicrobium sp. Leaf350 TaxID=2876565 RepID=UPI001E2BCB68|nr:oxidoreductase [Aeromicrobium sp. Leaf350]